MYDKEFIYNPTMVSDMKYVTKELVLIYTEELEFTIMQLSASIQEIKRIVCILNNNGTLIDEVGMDNIIKNAMDKSAIK